MRIKFNSIKDEHAGFEVLSTITAVFTYFGDGIINVNKKQIKLLESHNVKFIKINSEKSHD